MELMKIRPRIEVLAAQSSQVRTTLILIIYLIDNFHSLKYLSDRLCGLVFRVPDYRSRGPGSFPGATKFTE
jgi:hypothetical protein